MKATSINNVCIFVTDLDAARAFYAERLGLIEHNVGDGWAWLALPDQPPIFLVRKEAVTPLPWPALCLTVDSVEAADDIRQTAFSGEQPIYEMEDPSGNRIELVT